MKKKVTKRVSIRIIEEDIPEEIIQHVDRQMSYLKELEEYFNTTPKEQVLKDWKQTEEFEVGPSVDLTQTQIAPKGA